MLRLLAFLVATSSIVTAQITVSGPEGDCGFSAFKAIRIPHYVDRSVLNKVTPQYPSASKVRGLTGAVRVRILIDAEGQVQETCPEFIRGEPQPDRSLVVAAEAAALQWKFVPHFGFSKDEGLQFKYAKDVLIFNFVLPAESTRKRDDEPGSP
jgi:TonB family protein